MRKILLFGLTIFMTFAATAQTQDCFQKLEDAFAKRGSYTVADDMHKNVIVSFFEGDVTSCLTGKVRVENGVIVSVFLQYRDDTFELFMDKDIYTAKKQAPLIINGISEMIVTSKNEKFRVVFIDKLKPKPKAYKSAQLPDDL
ncbi:MAG: hypothetical protein PHQ74_03935 [Crocinitomicaceae bacterium]|nr:hypothetical protein [Crocinitomicaceae bacterium]